MERDGTALNGGSMVKIDDYLICFAGYYKGLTLSGGIAGLTKVIRVQVSAIHVANMCVEGTIVKCDFKILLIQLSV
jgi:hypothetical protein